MQDRSVNKDSYTKTLNPGVKRTEVGFLINRKPMHVYLFSERFPIWLFSLEASWCLSLVIVGHASYKDLTVLCSQGEKDILDIVFEPFMLKECVSFRTSGDIPLIQQNESPLILVSGSLESFLLPKLELFQDFKLMGVVDSHFVARLRNGKPTATEPRYAQMFESLRYTSTWCRLRHATTGGPTEFAALFAYNNIATKPTLSVLQRGIRHIFTSSIKPGSPPKVLPADGYGVFYRLDDRLHPGLYHLPVLCSSMFHASGQGFRVLTTEELATGHGFPRQLIMENFPVHFLAYPPCQVLTASLDPVWEISNEVVMDRNPRPIKRQHNDLQTWIPSLKRSLTHDWIDATLITATASKADDAALPCRLWDARLSLLFPGCLSCLEFVRQRLLQRMRRRLLREIRVYMRVTFGTTWAGQLCRARQHVREGSRKEQLEGGVNVNVIKTLNVIQNLNSKFVNTNINVQCLSLVSNEKVTMLMDDTITFDNKVHKESVDRVDDAHRLLQGTVKQTKTRTGAGVKRLCSSSCEGEAEGDVCITTSASNVMNDHSRSLMVTKSNVSKRICVRQHESIDIQLHLEGEKVTEVLSKICNSTWWEWDAGSALFFWRWGESSLLARDGMLPFLTSALPRNTKKSRSLARDVNIEKITEKLSTILKRGYIQQGNVKSLIDVFAVPKGSDIRLVYNGSSCGLNEATWAPNFWLPYPRTALKLLDYNFYSADVDLGEMFLNFPLHDSIRAFSGIDLSPYQKQLGIGDGKKSVWYRWTRNWMGARMSPYSSVQFCSLAEEFCRGNNKDVTNPLRWDVIILNLPGSKSYDPSKPRVYKWDRISQCMAGEFVIFVDDCRATGQTIELVWQIARQVCSRVQFLGVQDATRKRKPPTKTPGAWAGAVFATTEDTVTKTVTQEKWEKAQNIIKKLNDQIEQGGLNTQLVYKELEVARGFLGHLSMTYEVMVPFLKGFHLALACHLPKRNQEGWKLTDKAWASYMLEKNAFMTEESVDTVIEGHQIGEANKETSTPIYVKVTTHLRNDLRALACFTEGAVPPIINDRSAKVQIVRYGFGDASGTGFGSTIQTELGLKYRVGVWGSDEEEESSNYKELENVVTTIEEEALLGNLNDAALFFFTDNTTVEAALYKGNSSSQKLFELVVRFRKIQLIYGMQVVVSHVSGKRMIHQGTDGVSRGNMREGVGSGIEMLQFIPLHLGAVERHKPLLEWIKSVTDSNLEYLTPYDWFTRGHDHWKGKTDSTGFWRITTKPGIFLWAPPPAAAEAAIEQLRRALIKRQNSTHIFVCPRLLTMEWLKQLHKAADMVVSLPAGADNQAWPKQMLEPLTIAFVFPFLSVKPWKRKRTPKMYYVARTLSGMWKENNVDAGDFLRKFFKTQMQLQGMSECVVRKVLYFHRGVELLCENNTGSFG